MDLMSLTCPQMMVTQAGRSHLWHSSIQLTMTSPQSELSTRFSIAMYLGCISGRVWPICTCHWDFRCHNLGVFGFVFVLFCFGSGPLEYRFSIPFYLGLFFWILDWKISELPWKKWACRCLLKSNVCFCCCSLWGKS